MTDEAELTTTYQETVEDDANDGENSHDKDYQDSRGEDGVWDRCGGIQSRTVSGLYTFQGRWDLATLDVTWLWAVAIRPTS